MLRRRALAQATRLPRGHQLRCLASKGGSSEEKSWSEIAAEAATVAKDLAKKVGSGIAKAVEAIVPAESARSPPAPRERRARADVRRPDVFGGGGLLGGLLGRALGSAISALGEQVRAASEAASEVQERAAAIIEGSGEVRESLGGGVRCLPPVSQSSMSSSVNGRSSKTVTLVLPVVGSTGRATAQVQYSDPGGEGGGRDLSVAVQLPGGRVLRLDGGGGSGRGGATKTIDVEWREL